MTLVLSTSRNTLFKLLSVWLHWLQTCCPNGTNTWWICRTTCAWPLMLIGGWINGAGERRVPKVTTPAECKIDVQVVDHITWCLYLSLCALDCLQNCSAWHLGLHREQSRGKCVHFLLYHTHLKAPCGQKYWERTTLSLTWILILYINTFCLRPTTRSIKACVDEF